MLRVASWCYGWWRLCASPRVPSSISIGTSCRSAPSLRLRCSIATRVSRVRCFRFRYQNWILDGFRWILGLWSNIL
jgi:hypothetical protein